MLSCKDITENANAYLDKELPFFTRMKVKLHLSMCIHCRRYVDQLNTTIRALGNLNKADETVSEHVVDDVVSRLKQVNQDTTKSD
ncbi:MAG: zf-HC2 domain-containing protein [Gammaproteobacteria bacterium]|jgi:predicted anti-sigma-YlaC factor YlaD